MHLGTNLHFLGGLCQINDYKGFQRVDDPGNKRVRSCNNINRNRSFSLPSRWGGVGSKTTWHRLVIFMEAANGDIPQMF